MTLGPVKPWVRDAAEEIASHFNIETMYGVGFRDGPSDHPLGLAVDFMVYGDRGKGQAIADYARSNASRLSIHYIVWYQHIWNRQRDSEGWRLQPNRGSATQNHMDHVHVSFNNIPGNAGMPSIVPASFTNPLNIPGQILGQLEDIRKVVTAWSKIATWLVNPHNYLRMAMFVVGVILTAIALIRLPVGKTVAQTAVKVS